MNTQNSSEIVAEGKDDEKALIAEKTIDGVSSFTDGLKEWRFRTMFFMLVLGSFFPLYIASAYKPIA